jgi:hypothetical protein
MTVNIGIYNFPYQQKHSMVKLPHAATIFPGEVPYNYASPHIHISMTL